MTVTAPAHRANLWKKSRIQLALFFAVLGPGFITAMVDNDCSGILTYSQAGARWGYLPLWTLIPITQRLFRSSNTVWRRSSESAS